MKISMVKNVPKQNAEYMTNFLSQNLGTMSFRGVSPLKLNFSCLVETKTYKRKECGIVFKFRKPLKFKF
jgi:hypothetical protein